MVVNYSDLELVVKFSHSPAAPTPPRKQRLEDGKTVLINLPKAPVPPRLCECAILVGRNSDGKYGLVAGQELAYDAAICQPDDNYCRAVGRAISFKRAIKILFATLREYKVEVNDKLVNEFVKALREQCKMA